MEKALLRLLNRQAAGELPDFDYRNWPVGRDQFRLLYIERRIPFLDLKTSLDWYDFNGQSGAPYMNASHTHGDARILRQSRILI